MRFEPNRVDVNKALGVHLIVSAFIVHAGNILVIQRTGRAPSGYLDIPLEDLQMNYAVYKFLALVYR